MSGKILVTGATGNTGSGVVAALRSAGVDVRAFVRDRAKAEPLKNQGAEVMVGDLDKPETLDAAVKGVEKIYLLTWNGPTQARQVLNVVEAAKRSGGEPHIVRHSAWGSEKSRIIQQTNEAEAALKASGLAWTILRPTFFMQNTLMAAQTVKSDGVIYWDWNNGKAGMIDIRDVVEAAAAVLTGGGHEGKSYLLTGPASISFHDVAAALSRVLGKPVKYVSVPFEASRNSMVNMGFPEWIADGYVELSQGFSENFADLVTDHVPTLTGHPARSYEAFVRDFKQIFGG
jgi:uncharacterized protein YbjT (DUF2867 family)